MVAVRKPRVKKITDDTVVIVDSGIKLVDKPVPIWRKKETDLQPIAETETEQHKPRRRREVQA